MPILSALMMSTSRMRSGVDTEIMSLSRASRSWSGMVLLLEKVHCLSASVKTVASRNTCCECPSTAYAGIQPSVESSRVTAHLHLFSGVIMSRSRTRTPLDFETRGAALCWHKKATLVPDAVVAWLVVPMYISKPRSRAYIWYAASALVRLRLCAACVSPSERKGPCGSCLNAGSLKVEWSADLALSPKAARMAAGSRTARYCFCLSGSAAGAAAAGAAASAGAAAAGVAAV
mmetsp:Transcript_2362/g.6700  ORF Transcript_2362/g.6700 Transcript_2362/m.6700 type:complete len:232 (-) Transcript_2362:236-931(-)